MKLLKFVLPLLIFGFIYVTATSCRKKEVGNCYCSYLSGDKTHYDLTMLPRPEQKDSCAILDQNATHFAGDCKLK